MSVYRHLHLFAACACLSLSGCAIGKDYSRPEMVTPERWRTELSEIGDATLPWWQRFEDPVLVDLVTRALHNNRDIQEALYRIDRFYALYGIAKADLFPQSGVEGQYTRGDGSDLAGARGFNTLRDDFLARASAAWEIDLWGKVRRSKEAAFASLLSAEAARRGVVLSVVTGVVQSYAGLRRLDEQLAISHATVKSREKSLELAKARFTAGATSELDLRQAEAELLETQVTIPMLEREIAKAEHALSILLGENPQEHTRGSSIGLLAQVKGLPQGLPSDLLGSRPDLLQAEYDLIAANAEVGVAKAKFFPSITLTGTFGYESEELSDLFERPGRAWSYGPQLSMPILTFGKVLSGVEAAEAEKNTALVSYTKSVQNAFREVEDALVSFKKISEELDARQKQVAALRRYVDLARISYEGGQSSYLEVLDAERRLFGAELEYVATQGARVGAYVDLFKTFGGSWVDNAVASLGVVEEKSDSATLVRLP